MMARDEDQDFDELDEEELGDFAPVLHARSMAEAGRYLQLLEDYGIPARIDEDFQPKPKAVAEAVTVLVPESLLEDAKGFIADLEEMEGLSKEEEMAAEDEEDDEVLEGEKEQGVEVGEEEEAEDEEDEEDEDEDELDLNDEEDDEEEEDEDEEDDEGEEEDEEEDDEDDKTV